MTSAGASRLAADTATQSRLTLLGERAAGTSPVSPKGTAAPESTSLDSMDAGRTIHSPATASTSPPSAPVFLAQMLAVMTTIAMMLATRLLLLLAILAAFVLAYQSMMNPTIMTLAVSTVFDTLVVLPLAALYIWRG